MSIQLKGSIPLPLRQASNPLIISIQTHLLASALVYCIKTTRFKLLCVAVVEYDLVKVSMGGHVGVHGGLFH